MDNIDRKIIETLRHDGRASHAQMARELGLSEGTARRRLSKLLQDKVIKVAAIPDPERLGFHTSAFIGLQVDPAQVEAVADKLCDLPEAEHVSITTGSYDIFIWVNLATPESLATFLHNRVGTVEGVRHTETFLSLETRKRAFGASLL